MVEQALVIFGYRQPRTQWTSQLQDGDDARVALQPKTGGDAVLET
jgi:hypothetical protein